MDHHLKDFFSTSDESSRGCFHSVIVLHEAPDIDWPVISRQVPDLCKGWYELSRLPAKDRIEFTREFWLTKLPYREGFSEFLLRFFDALDDIGVYITQKKFDDPHEVNLVYSLKEDSGFYRGGSPATDESLRHLQKAFPDYLLPADYIAFLQIHDGFWKTTDATGIAHSAQLRELYDRFQKKVSKLDVLKTTDGDEVDPSTLIPFYESFGMPYFQCFWGEWYPEGEMGNIYYSDIAKTISCTRGREPSPENMAFPTFIDWLKFYLERIV